MNIAILGSGPDALFAAHAAAGLGEDVRIFSDDTKHPLRGAQYMLRPVPGLSGDSFEIRVVEDGPQDDYMRKVEFDQSMKMQDGTLQAWDTREAYERAWLEFGPRIRSLDYEGYVPWSIWNWADKVITTIPADNFCDLVEHQFYSRTIYTVDYVKALGWFEDDAIDNTIVCSGFKDDWWFRQSRVLGHETTEFPAAFHPGAVRAEIVPVLTTCTCSDTVMRLGRLAKWDNSVRFEDAFYTLQSFITGEDAIIPPGDVL